MIIGFVINRRLWGTLSVFMLRAANPRNIYDFIIQAASIWLSCFDYPILCGGGGDGGTEPILLTLRCNVE